MKPVADPNVFHLGTLSKGSCMSREAELAVVRDQVSILAEQVVRLLDVISIRSGNGWNVEPYEEKLALLETMLWKLHRRQTRLKQAAVAAPGIVH